MIEASVFCRLQPISGCRLVLDDTSCSSVPVMTPLKAGDIADERPSRCRRRSPPDRHRHTRGCRPKKSVTTTTSSGRPIYVSAIHTLTYNANVAVYIGVDWTAHGPPQQLASPDHLTCIAVVATYCATLRHVREWMTSRRQPLSYTLACEMPPKLDDDKYICMRLITWLAHVTDIDL